MIFEGKISYRTSIMCLLFVNSVVFMFFQKTFILLICLFLLGEVVARENLSTAKMNGNLITVTKCYLFGLVKTEKQYQFHNLTQEIEGIIETTETFSIKTLNEITKSKITFYIK